MRIANIKAGNIINPITQVKMPLRDGDHAPCYYADIEKDEKRKEWKWKVGCKYQGQTEEYSFKMSKAGDIEDKDFWQRVTSLEFATELIDLFREGGELAVKNWIKDGCP
jgi:hypothetical protein